MIAVMLRTGNAHFFAAWFTLEKSKDSGVFSSVVKECIFMFEPNISTMPAARSRMNVKTLTSLAMLTAITYAVMYLSKLLPQLYGFLQLEAKSTVVCIGGFVFGPLAAAAIAIIVAIVEMFTVGDTGPIGCIMNCLAACAFACPAAFIYKRAHTRRGAVAGLGVGVAVTTAVMLLWNYFLVPIYQGIPREQVAAMLPTIFLPFNLVKGGLNMGLTLVLYKPVVTALRKARLIPESQRNAAPGKSQAGFLLFSLAVLGTFAALVLVLAEKI